MRDCPSQKRESHETTHHKKDVVSNTFGRKAHVDLLVKKDFAVRGDDSSES